MSDVVIEPLKGTVYVGRKVAPRQYESLEVGLHFPVELPQRTAEDTDTSYSLALSAAVRDVFQIAKVAVYDQLGLEYTDNNGIIVENIASKFAGSTVATPAPVLPAAAPNRNFAASDIRATASAGDVPACPDCAGAMYDNRVGKRNPKGPDFKCKSTACNKAVWLKK